jgi:CRP-like cAMP-binding protein
LIDPPPQLTAFVAQLGAGIACVRTPFVRGKGGVFMKNRGVFVRKRDKTSFDPKEFLAKVGEGKTISKYRKDQIVFSQGQVADAVFYIQQGKVKLTVVSEQGKEAVVAILGPGHFFGEGCLNGPSVAHRIQRKTGSP